MAYTREDYKSDFRERIKQEMFDRDFYPTPDDVIAYMLDGLDLEGKTVLEPSAGKGNIAKVLKELGANVIFCETNNELAQLASKYGDMIATDFLTVSEAQISHIDYVIMNPPFSADETHILHAFRIMPDNCKLIGLCNWNTIDNKFSKSRKELAEVIGMYGRTEKLGKCFENSERQTSVDVAVVFLQKYGSSDGMEDYFTDEEDELEGQENGIMTYNAVREVVQRYVNAVRLYDEVLIQAVKMNDLIKHVGSPTQESNDREKLVFTCSSDNVAVSRQMFVNGLQMKSWAWIFNKMDMSKFVTTDVMKDINKFIEGQKKLKFTMRNIYKMFEVIIGTSAQYMDKALTIVFDDLTKHHDGNRWMVEGWKTNSHYLVNQKFIKPYAISKSYISGCMEVSYGTRNDQMEDLLKALCYVEGDNYYDFISLSDRVYRDTYRIKKGDKYVKVKSEFDNKKWVPLKHGSLASAQMWLAEQSNPEDYTIETPPNWGELFDWGYFEVRAYMKGTCHFKFKSEDVWMRFNQAIARIKGFPLPEKTSTPKENKSRKKKQ